MEEKPKEDKKVLDKYSLTVNEVVVDISIIQELKAPVPKYNVEITNISDTTKILRICLRVIIKHRRIRAAIYKRYR